MTMQEQKQDLAETENGQPQEPEPSRDATVCDAYWVARQMLDGPVDGFSRDAWHDALSTLVDALHGAAMHPERAPVPAVDFSWSIPNALTPTLFGTPPEDTNAT